ncbi:ATP-binding cassette sub-family C member 4-like isoform X2 [Acropora millepora]|uniref:ATP-binding cassette sub-family C member 4-like isoform X2 n=1 Tax=Acropora millepora TaxID=45264 RepID=UPI001CF16277|nr:ATP-binding cassette sub-family C member 4-like isoform X2 [Acropora millepora]
MSKRKYEPLATEEEDGDDVNESSHSNTCFLSNLSIYWMNSIFKIGSKRPLNQSDFLPLRDEDRTRNITERLQEEWDHHVKECRSNGARQPKLWKCLMRMVSWEEIFYFMSFFFVESLARVTQPLVLAWIIHLLSSSETQQPFSYVSCLLLSLSGLSTACTHFSQYRFDLLGMRLRSALKGIVYLKIPLISQQTIRQTTEGNITSLISNDAQTVEQAPKWIFPSLCALFEVPTIVCLLLFLIGWQPLVGVAFLILQVPCIIKISSVCARLRLKTAKVTDQRLSAVNEMVTGIRALKTHAWEKNYRQKIQEVRGNEISVLLRKNGLLSIVEGLTFSSSIVAAFLAILTLVGTRRSLTPTTAFVVLSFMNILRHTLCVRLPNALPITFEIWISLTRIEQFLLLENLPRLGNRKYSQEPSEQENTFDTKPNSYSDWLKDFSLEQSEHHGETLSGFPDTMGEERKLSLTSDCLSLTPLRSPGNEINCKPTGKVKENVQLSVSNLTCILQATGAGEKHLLRDVTFDAPPRSLTVLNGAVGSGKSTLLATIAGEVVKSSGTVTCCGTLAYVPQSSWVFAGTLRDNVLFGEPFHEEKYREVIEACSLTEDIDRFPNGDFSFVGERGVALSGGQRARVSLARAVYANADVYLLDDPLSAVDAKVGDHIFRQCVCKLLKDKIVVLGSYAEMNMKAADQVVALNNGTIQGIGGFEDLKAQGKLTATITTPADITNMTEEDPRILESKEEIDKTQSNLPRESKRLVQHLQIEEEDKATGHISFKLYWDYFRAGTNPAALVAVVFLFLVTQVIMVSPNIWLFFMTKMTLENQQKPITLAIYASLASAALGLAIIRGYIFIYVCLKAAESLHNQMVSSLLQTLVLFFDTNPAGRILNRFSKDIGEIDDLLPKIFLLTTQMMLFVFTAAILPSFTNAWLVLVTIPIFLIFAYLGWYYLKTSRELKRLESICRSPVFSHFSETLTGLDTIRTRKRERDFIDKFYQHQDSHNQAFSMVLASGRWIGARGDLLCSVFIAVIALLTILLSQNPALAGLALASVVETSILSNYAVRQFSEVENFMTSVERVMAYTSLDPEPGYKIKALPPINWPHNGHVSFRNVVMRYYPDGPQVLKNLSFEISGKTRVGIVGRTGDGKSSLVAAILRMPESEGDIIIDDVPIKGIQLQETRRCISVLSQSPVLFSGTLRKNLDPLENHSDVELWQVLQEVKLSSLVESLEGQLDFNLLERGENLSVGERQLICLARTLLQQSKIVILDEPTAHVDPNTEKTIWSTVREKLNNSTVIIIAHRLNTVKDCDVIMVLREGQVAELGRSRKKS